MYYRGLALNFSSIESSFELQLGWFRMLGKQNMSLIKDIRVMSFQGLDSNKSKRPKQITEALQKCLAAFSEVGIVRKAVSFEGLRLDWENGKFKEIG